MSDRWQHSVNCPQLFKGASLHTVNNGKTMLSFNQASCGEPKSHLGENCLSKNKRSSTARCTHMSQDSLSLGKKGKSFEQIFCGKQKCIYREMKTNPELENGISGAATNCKNKLRFVSIIQGLHVAGHHVWNVFWRGSLFRSISSGSAASVQFALDFK